MCRLAEGRDRVCRLEGAAEGGGCTPLNVDLECVDEGCARRGGSREAGSKVVIF